MLRAVASVATDRWCLWWGSYSSLKPLVRPASSTKNEITNTFLKDKS